MKPNTSPPTKSRVDAAKTSGVFSPRKAPRAVPAVNASSNGRVISR